MGVRQDDGEPLRVHLESDARQGGTSAAIEAAWRLANPPPLPPLAAHVWPIFIDLCRTRQSGGMAPSAITRHDIHAWERDERPLERWERQAIMALDAEQMAVWSANSADRKQQDKQRGNAGEAHKA